MGAKNPRGEAIERVEGIVPRLLRGYGLGMSKRPDAIEGAERVGFDLSLIDANLSYSYEKRILLHDHALALVLELKQAGRRLRDDSQSAAAATVRR